MAAIPSYTRSQLMGMSAGRILQGQLAPAPFNERFAKVFGSSLTPQAATKVISMAAAGYMWALADMLDEVRERDPHLQSVLQKREMRVTSAEWELRPPDGTGKRAQTIADWCRDRLLEIEQTDDLSRSWHDALGDMMGGLYHGRSVHEVIWKIQGRYAYPSKLEFVHARRCAYTTDFRLHLWDAQGTNESIWMPTTQPSSQFGEFPGLPIDGFPAGKFIAHRPRVRGVYPTREGLGTLVVWWSLFKRFGMRDFLAYLEWAGRGFRIGTYASGNDPVNPARASPDDIAAMKAALDDLSSAVSAVVPDTTKVEVHDAPNVNDIHEKMITLCNNEISKAVLLEAITTESGINGANRAGGEAEVANVLGRMLARHDSKQLAATIRRDVLRPMVQRSFGMQAPVPEIVWELEEKDSMDKLAARYKTLAEAGVVIGQAYAREQLGIPEPTEGEDTIGDKPDVAEPIGQTTKTGSITAKKGVV